MATDLDDPYETRSFLVPSYEFEQGSDARKFDPDPRTHLGPVSVPEDLYTLVQRDEYHFYPRASSQFIMSASALFNPSIGENGRMFSLRLQESSSEKPAGVRSRCLMIEGRRLSPKRDGERTELVPSYAAWQTPGNDEPLWVSRIAYQREEDDRVLTSTKSISSHWSGRGVLCAVSADSKRHLLLVEFRLFDNDPNRSDLLKIWASRHVLSANDWPPRDPIDEPLSQSWCQLIARAEKGYFEECVA
jgi:hypothetical protein